MLTLVNVDFFPSLIKNCPGTPYKKITFGAMLLSSQPCTRQSDGRQVHSSAVNHDLTPV